LSLERNLQVRKSNNATAYGVEILNIANDAETLEHPPIEHKDSDEMLSSRLQYTRNKSLETLSELHGNVSGVLNTLSAQRWPVWVRSGLLYED
jgi:hypothetical protein